jgi:hypothetical protein
MGMSNQRQSYDFELKVELIDEVKSGKHATHWLIGSQGLSSATTGHSSSVSGSCWALQVLHQQLWLRFDPFYALSRPGWPNVTAGIAWAYRVYIRGR